MSVRAYKVIALQYAENPTFNCWHDEKLMDFLTSEELYDGRNVDGVGTIEVSVELLQKALANGNELKWDEYIREALKADMTWAKKKGQDYIRYECF